MTLSDKVRELEEELDRRGRVIEELRGVNATLRKGLGRWIEIAAELEAKVPTRAAPNSVRPDLLGDAWFLLSRYACGCARTLSGTCPKHKACG